MTRAAVAIESPPPKPPLPQAQMTTFATRPPLQPLDNPHMMSGRRTSARLAGKEDEPQSNAMSCSVDAVKKGQNTSAGVKQVKNNVNVSGPKSSAKRKPAYDEEDDGFTFSRTRSKKAKPTNVEPLIEEEEASKAPTVSLPTRKPRKQSLSSPNSNEKVDGVKAETRRSTRHSSDNDNGHAEILQVKKTRRTRQSSEAKHDNVGDPFKPTHTLRRVSHKKPEQASPTEIHFDATKIALPFADTPIIRRNKEMRKGAQAGSRRSSLGNRGRRASSLIDSGRSNALPHDEVDGAEFYKHIESEGMPEPRRMRQLLMWCGARALADKPSFSSEDGNARLAAREIQSQLLKDFSTKSGLSDWFDRRESTPPPNVPKANPKNLSNMSKIQDLEDRIARLQAESQTWQSLLRPPPESALRLPLLPSNPPSSSAIDSSLLTDPNQKAALSALHSFTATTADGETTLSATTSSRIRHIAQNLEFEVDKFAANVHALNAYKDAADRVAGEALATSAETLERRDREGRRRANGGGGDGGEGLLGDVSTRDVLRGLSRVIDR